MEVLKRFSYAGHEYEVVNDKKGYNNEIYVTLNKKNIGGWHFNISDEALLAEKCCEVTLDSCAACVEDAFKKGRYKQMEENIGNQVSHRSLEKRRGLFPPLFTFHPVLFFRSSTCLITILIVKWDCS